MKKKFVSMLLCLALGASIAACGSSSTDNTADSESSVSAESTVSESGSSETASVDSSSEEEEESEDIPLLDTEDYELDECITLGEYKGLSFTRTVEPVTEGQILLRISQQTGETGEELTDEDAEVQEGDTAVIEYEGKIDGEAFEGGTSTEPYELQIGSDTFIDGFEDGVIGMKAGETKDLELTFPENYGSSDLAGQDVVFTVTVNSIKRLNIDDDWVEENAGSDFANAEEYLDSFREVLEEENETAADNSLYSEAWTTVRSNSTYLALPKSMVEEAAQVFEDTATQQAEMYGYELEDMIEAYGGEESYEEQKDYYARYTAMNTLLMQALMEAEGVEKGDDDYNQELDDLVESVGAESADELIESYGEDDVDEVVLQTVLVKKILSYADVTEA